MSKTELSLGITLLRKSDPERVIENFQILMACFTSSSNVNKNIYNGFANIDHAMYKDMIEALNIYFDNKHDFDENFPIYFPRYYEQEEASYAYEGQLRAVFKSPILDYKFSSLIYYIESERFFEKGLDIRQYPKGIIIRSNATGACVIIRDRNEIVIPAVLFDYFENAYSIINWEKLATFIAYLVEIPYDPMEEVLRIQNFIKINSIHPLHPILYSWLLGLDVVNGAPGFEILCPHNLDYCEGVRIQSELPDMKELESEWKYQAQLLKLQKKKAKRERKRNNKFSNKFLNKARDRTVRCASFDVENAHRRGMVSEKLLNYFYYCCDHEVKEMVEYIPTTTTSDALQLFAFVVDENLKRNCENECSNAIGDICHLTKENYKIKFNIRKHYVMPQASDYDHMWEIALREHYDLSDHHPEGHNEQMPFKDSLECLFDLLISAMRLNDNAYDAYLQMKTWLFDWVTASDSDKNWKSVAIIKPKFALLDPAAIIAFISILVKRGLSTSSCRKIHFTEERHAPCEHGEDRLPILEMFNKITSFKSTSSMKREFVKWVKLPKFRAYIRDTEWHCTIMNSTMSSLGLIVDHDSSKFNWHSVLAYTWRWYIKDTLKNGNKRVDYNIGRKDIDKLPQEMKQHLYSFIEGTSDENGFRARVTSAISKASGIVLSPLSEPINAACDAITNMVHKMEGLIDTVVDKISGFVNKICGFVDLKKYVNFEQISLLVLDYLIFVNTDNFLLKTAVLMHALSTLKILSKVKEILEYIFFTLGRDTKDKESPIEGTSESSVWNNFITLLEKIDPRIAGILTAIIIGLILGVKALRNAKLSDLTSKTVEFMKDWHFMGAGLLGMDRMFKYISGAVKVALDWIKSHFGIKSDDEKEKQEQEKVTQEICVNLSALDFYSSQEGINLLRSSKTEKQRAKIVLNNAYVFLDMARANKMSKDNKILYMKAEKKISDLHNTLTRLSHNTAFRRTPFHIQFCGVPGIGKSKLMRAIVYDLWQTYHSKRADFSQCIYQPNFDKKHWDGYHGQPILMIDDAFQLLDPEVLMQMVLIVNTIPMLLPMANLSDKEETLQADDIVSSTNNPYPYVEKIAQMNAIHRRRHLLVETICDQDVIENSSHKFDLNLYYCKYMALDSTVQYMKKSDQEQFIREFLYTVKSDSIIDFEKAEQEQINQWISLQIATATKLCRDWPSIDLKSQYQHYVDATIAKDKKFPHLRFTLLRPVLDESMNKYYDQDNTLLPSGVRVPTSNMTYYQLLATVHARRKAIRKEEVDAFALRDNFDHIYEKYSEISDLFSLDEQAQMSEQLRRNLHDPNTILEDETERDENPLYMELPENELDYSKDDFCKNSLFAQQRDPDDFLSPANEIFIIRNDDGHIVFNITQRKVKIGLTYRPLNVHDVELLASRGLIDEDRAEQLKELEGTSVEICSHSEGAGSYPVDMDSSVYCQTCAGYLCSQCQKAPVPFDKKMREKCDHTHICDESNLKSRCVRSSAGHVCSVCTLPLCPDHVNEECKNHVRRGLDEIPAYVQNMYVVSMQDTLRKMESLVKKCNSVEAARKKYPAIFKKLEEYMEGIFDKKSTSVLETKDDDHLGCEFTKMFNKLRNFDKWHDDPVGFIGDGIDISIRPGKSRQAILYEGSRADEISPDMLDFNDYLPEYNLTKVVLLEREAKSELWRDFLKSKNRLNTFDNLCAKFGCETTKGMMFPPCSCHGNIGSTLPINIEFLKKVRREDGKWIYKYDKDDLKNHQLYWKLVGVDHRNAVPHPMYSYNKDTWWFRSYDFFANELNEQQREYLIQTLQDRSIAYNRALRVFELWKQHYQAKIFAIPFAWTRNIKMMWKHPNLRNMRNVTITLILTFGLISTIKSFASLFKGRKIEDTSKVLFKQKSKKPLIIGTAQQDEDFQMGLRNNLVQVEFNGKTANAIGLDGQLLMMNQHLINFNDNDFKINVQFTERSSDMFPYVIKKENVHLIPNSDLLVCYIPEISPFKRVIHKFRSKEQLEKHMVTNLTVMYRKNGALFVKSFVPEDIYEKFTRTRLDGTKVIATNVLSYKGDPESGSSGGFLTTSDSYCSAKIIGVQCYRDTNGRNGFGHMVFREQLELIKDRFENNIEHEGPYECIDGTSTQCEQLIESQISVEGSVPDEHIVGIVHKNNFVKTPISKHFHSDRIPAIVYAFDSRVPEGDHPLKHSLNKVGRDVMQPLDQELLNYASKQYSIYLKNEFNEKLQYLSFEDTLLGIDGGDDKINVKTSPGIPWIYKRTEPGKKSFVNFDEEGNISVCAQELRDEFEYWDTNLCNNIVPSHSAYDFPKDELRPVKKALGPPIKTRSITVCNMTLNLVWRKYTLHFDYLNHLLADGTHPHCVGINPESLDWTRLYHSLSMVNDCGYDFDVGNWDGHYTQQLALAVADIYADVYNDKGDAGDRARRAILSSVFGGYVQFGDMVYHKHRGLESGFAGTAEMNTLGHVLLFFYFFCKIMRKSYGLLPTFVSFQNFVKVFCYGDDIIFTVSPEIETVFNGRSVADEYQHYGWPVTSAAKVSVDNNAITPASLDQLTFLKRSFIPCEIDGLQIIFGALDKGVIEDFRYWMRRTANEKEQFYINLNLGLDYAFMHGKEYFEKYLLETNNALIQSGMKSLFSTWETVKYRLLDRFLLEY